jgi:hypothetical protein
VPDVAIARDPHDIESAIGDALGAIAPEPLVAGKVVSVGPGRTARE